MDKHKKLFKLTKSQATKMMGMGYTAEELQAQGFFSDLWSGAKKLGSKVVDGAKKLYKNPIVKAGVDSAVKAARSASPELHTALSALGMGPEKQAEALKILLKRPMVKKVGTAVPIGVAPAVPAKAKGRGRPKKAPQANEAVGNAGIQATI
jgi:hypothetical protein